LPERPCILEVKFGVVGGATSQKATRALARSPSIDVHGNASIAKAIGSIFSKTA
jgi:hypothetical protein